MTTALSPEAGAATRRTIAAICAALLLLLVATVAMSAWLLRTHEIGNWRKDLENQTEVVAENVAQTLGGGYLLLDSLAGLAHGASAAELTGIEVYRTLRDQSAMAPQVSLAAILDANGQVLGSSRSYPAPRSNHADRDYFRYHREHAAVQPHLSGPRRSALDGRWTLYLSRRLDDAQGRFAGVVVVGMASDSFAGFFHNASLGERATVALYLDDYTLLARWPRAGAPIGQPEPDGIARQLLGSGLRHGVQRSDGAPGGMTAVRMVRDHPLIVTVAVTDGVLLADWRASMWLLGAVSLVAAGATLWAFWLVNRLLRRRQRDAERALALKADADAASQAKSRLLAMISRAIHAPLWTVSETAQSLLETRLEPGQRQQLAAMHRDTGALLAIIDDVLTYSRIESGQMPVAQQPYDPAQLVADAVARHRPVAQAKGLRLDATLAAPPGTVRGDPIRVAQVLDNLLDNAVKFTAAGSVEVAFSALPHDEHWLLRYSVRDTGCGIEAEAQRQLFEPFLHWTGADAAERSTGLGLAICSRLAVLMGGVLTCSSVPGAGATFSLELPTDLLAPLIDARADRVSAVPAAASQGVPVDGPLAESAPVEAAAPAAAHAFTAATEAPGVGAVSAESVAGLRRVLLVEDTAMNRQLARVLLNRLGWEVDEAHDGAQALMALEHTRYTVVLMDCMMPVMDGYEATRRFRAIEAERGLARTPVVALTASAIEGDRERCFEAGVDDYLTKPYTSASFAAVLARWSGPAAA